MAWIKTIAVEDAEDDLKKQYDAAIRRAGRAWNVVKLMSLNPKNARNVDGPLRRDDAPALTPHPGTA